MLVLSFSVVIVILIMVSALFVYREKYRSKIVFTEIVEVIKEQIWTSFQEYVKQKLSDDCLNKFQKPSDLFLRTTDFDENTLEKIGNGNFGIVFKVKLEKKINLGDKFDLNHKVLKNVAVKKSTHVWDRSRVSAEKSESFSEFYDIITVVSRLGPGMTIRAQSEDKGPDDD